MASGFTGLIVYAFMPEKSKVKSFNWKVKHKNGKEEIFYFESKSNNNTYHWIEETKSLGLFKVEAGVGIPGNYVYSYFIIVEKTFEKSALDLEFSLNDFSTTKNCSINNITFSS